MYFDQDLFRRELTSQQEQAISGLRMLAEDRAQAGDLATAIRLYRFIKYLLDSKV